MTNKGKVLAAVIAVVVVLAGGAGFYFKGGDLMGKIFKTGTPVVNQVSVPVECPSRGGVTLYTTVSGQTAAYGSDFGSFYDVLKKEVGSNSGKLACPLKITMGDTGNFGYIVITNDSQVSFDDDDVSPMISFVRTIPGSSWHSVSLHSGDALNSSYGSIQIYSEDLNKTYGIYAQKSGDISVARIPPSSY